MDPSLISDPREQKWVAEIGEILDRQLEMTLEIPPVSIFKIPETITTKKPEAYKPQHVGFGPYHHFQPGPYSKMQQKKLVLLQRLLQDHKINDFRDAVLDKVKKRVPVIRACYDTFLQDDNVSMAWVFAIDGLFLLNLFQTSANKHPTLDPTKRLLAQDIMMVENQIPFLVLKEIHEVLHSSSSTNFPPSEFQSFSAIHSPPLQENLVVEKQIPFTEMNESKEVLYSDLLPSVHSQILPSVFQSFTEIHSPQLQEQMMGDNQVPFMEVEETGEVLYSSNFSFPIGSKTVIHDLPIIHLSSKTSSSDNNFQVSLIQSSNVDQHLPILYSSLGTETDFPLLSDNNFSPFIFRSFSETHSPLELCSWSQAPTHVEHLLHYMYGSIINNKPRPIIRYDDCMMEDMPYHPIGGSGPSNSGVTNPINNVLNFLQKVPQKEFVKLYEQTVTSLHNFSTNKTTIPSASELQRATRFRFHDLPKDEGIENIHIEENNIICLPRVTLNNESEVILRNLVAYETLMPHSADQSLPLTEYMGLMCGLIVNVEDVKLLKKENIIKGELGEGEVVKIFVGMSGSIMSLKTKINKCKLQEVIDEVNKVYKSRPRIRAYLLMKKLASWVLVVLTHMGSFVGATWKIVAFMISIVTVFMLTYQAYCDVYGCDKSNATMLPYASS
ncbi:hypothetical protein SSX86_019945 [Deinandra increscens subsp. villosa]|uniref:Uncharacterized protein n=1 Tax=Deinandra increscens subsp. villosa TaxID=3103831 RepID=A0AAP0CTK5_9ASTR